MAKPTLYMMLGYPGAGKTTVARIIEQLTGAIRLSSDQVRAETYVDPSFSEEEHQELYEKINRLTEGYLGQGRDVIYDANLNRYIHRLEKYDIAKRVGANTKLIWVQTPEEIAKHRATTLGENDEHRPFGNMAQEMFERIVSAIEQPKDSEHPIVVDGTQVSPEYIRSAIGI